jgi:hypothetical protein
MSVSANIALARRLYDSRLAPEVTRKVMSPTWCGTSPRASRAAGSTTAGTAPGVTSSARPVNLSELRDSSERAAPNSDRRRPTCQTVGRAAASRACAARKSPRSPRSAPTTTPGWNKAASGPPRPSWPNSPWVLRLDGDQHAYLLQLAGKDAQRRGHTARRRARAAGSQGLRSLTRTVGSHEMAVIRESSPSGHAAVPRKGQNDRQPAGHSPLDTGPTQDDLRIQVLASRIPPEAAAFSVPADAITCRVDPDPQY